MKKIRKYSLESFKISKIKATRYGMFSYATLFFPRKRKFLFLIVLIKLSFQSKPNNFSLPSLKLKPTNTTSKINSKN